VPTPQTDFISPVKRAYPSAREEDIKVFDDGWDYVVYVVNGSQTFRFPRRDDYSKTLPREVAFLDTFSSLSSVQVPKLTLHKTPDGKPYVTYSFIPGVPFEGDVAQNCSPKELHEIAQQIANFLSILHSFPIKTAKTMGFDELDSVKYWSDRLNKIEKNVYPHLPASEQSWITELFAEFIEMITQNPFRNKLIHSDIMPGHIIINSTTHKLSGIIDFGDMEIADPAYDFTFLHKYGQEFLDTAYDNYKLDRDKTFEKRRQFYEDRLVVTDLEHSIEIHDKEKIELQKKQLTDYIGNG